MTFHQTYECSKCGYIFNGLSGIQDHGDMFKFHDISPMICKKCGNMKNVVTGYDIDDSVIICENCEVEMEYMKEDAIYKCPECNKQTLKCVNTDDIYNSGMFYIY